MDRLQRNPTDWSGWKLVANLPYSVASPILVELAQAKGNPDLMVVTLQLEVARRLTAQPGTEAYGVLTLLIQLHYKSLDSFKIPAGCFFPVPDVDSACVRLVRRSESNYSPELTSTYTRIVKRSFSQRRKMMFKLLKEDWPEDGLAPAFAAIGLSKDVRAESVSREQFVELARALEATERHEEDS
jgi:16S rRNA (adenine1518-N6/adenine1519-N6)-dimethyltransferase